MTSEEQKIIDEFNLLNEIGGILNGSDRDAVITVLIALTAQGLLDEAEGDPAEFTELLMHFAKCVHGHARRLAEGADKPERGLH